MSTLIGTTELDGVGRFRGLSVMTKAQHGYGVRSFWNRDCLPTGALPVRVGGDGYNWCGGCA